MLYNGFTAKWTPKALMYPPFSDSPFHGCQVTWFLLNCSCIMCVSEYMSGWESHHLRPNQMTLASVMSWNEARSKVIMSNGQSTNSVSIETAKWNHCIRSSQAGEKKEKKKRTWYCMVLHHFLKLAYTAILSNKGNKAEWHWERRLTVATSHHIK